MRGRKNKPVEIHILEGTFREGLHGGTPRPGGKPKLPKHLPAEERKVWREIVRQLEGLGVLTAADSFCVERLCTAIVRRRKAEAMLDEVGLTGIGAKQLYVIARGESDEEHRLRAECGMQPASRVRLRLQPVTESDEIEVRDRSKGLPPPTGTA